MKKFFSFNKTKLKHGSYATAITAVVIIVAILINILMGVLSNKGLLKVDLTKTGDNSISQENIDFIKSVDKQIKITVFSTEARYSGGQLANFAEQYKNVVDDSKYYAQTITLLNSYAELNKNIKIEYVDFYSDTTEKYAEDYPNLFYGDMVVEIGEGELAKSRLVTYEDIYTYSDTTGYADYGYSNYYVDSNRLETALSSAINTLVSGEERQLALVGTHSNTTYFELLYKNALSLNSFTVSSINDNILSKIDDEIDVLAIVAPVSDFLPSEISVMNEWLRNGEKLGRAIIFFPGVSMDKLPVLSEFLAEWGIKYGDGILYQTDSTQHASGDNTTMVAFVEDNEIANKMFNATDNAIIGSNLNMERAYETYASRKTTVLLSTNDQVAVKPSSASTSWTPADNAELKVRPNLIVTEEESIVDNQQYLGYVAAFSSIEFIYSDWAQYESLINLDAAVKTAVYISGMDTANKMTFVPKTITVESFADSVTESSGLVIRLIFAVVIPISLIVTGFVVWFRRKHR